MAFVYRKQKSGEQSTVSPGPGQYNEVKSSPTNAAVGFVDKVPRKLWQTQATTTPGPGQYNLRQQNLEMEGMQTLYSNTNLEFYVLDNFYTQNIGCTSAFKSSCKKFTNPTNSNPGPGHYDLQTQNIKRAPSCRWEKPTKLAKYLYQQNKKHAESINQININPYNTYQSLVSEIHRVQPKKQIVKSQDLKNNYKSVFSSKVERKTIMRPQTSKAVGPGTYNVQNLLSIPRKSFNCKQQNPPSQNSHNQGDEKVDGKSKKQKQKQNIGPGSYQVQIPKRPQTSQSRGIPCFGSKEQRFIKENFNKQSLDTKEPGPQSYFKPASKIQKKEPKKKIAFNSCTQKSDQIFHFVPSTKFTQLSPFTYKPKNDFDELLKRNYIKGSIGRFGSTVQRFKEKNNQQNDEDRSREIFIFDFQGPQNFKEKAKACLNFNRIKKATGKKLKAKNDQTLDQRPLCYDSQSKTIGWKFNQKCQIDAPFMIASSRFPTKQINYEQEIMNQILKQENKELLIGQNTNLQEIKKSRAKILKGNTQNISLFKKYNEIKGFQQVPNQQNVFQVGPQTYNPQPLAKKSYNILFNQ